MTTTKKEASCPGEKGHGSQNVVETLPEQGKNGGLTAKMTCKTAAKEV
jgi:hypothetical protein